MAEWRVRNPRGLVSRKEYGFDDFAWEHLNSNELYVLALTSDVGMDPNKIAPRVKSVIDSLLGVLQELNEKPITKETNLKQNDDISKVELDDLAKSIESPWYWDGVFLKVTSPGSVIIVQPESDGTEIGIYMAGKAAASIYENIARNLEGH